MTSFPEFFAEIDARIPGLTVEEPDPSAVSAPWLHEAFSSDRGIDVVLTDAAVDVDQPGTAWPEDEDDRSWTRLLENMAGQAGGAADFVARYRPWHLYRDSWGVEIYQDMLVAFTQALANVINVPAYVLAPFALRQVLAHEHVHFGFEVAGTEIEDLLGEPRYSEYVLRRYRAPNRWTRGPLEEVSATWAELAFARRPANRLKGKPRGYARAVTAVNRRSPDGYRDFALMADERRAERISADVAALIADREIWSSRWGSRVATADVDQVPVRWHGDVALLPVFGAMPKTMSAPNIRRFEAWLSRIGAEWLQGSKHAKVLLPNGRRWSYTATADHLLAPEAERLAQLLGLSGRRELFEHVAAKRVPDTLTSLAAPT